MTTVALATSFRPESNGLQRRAIRAWQVIYETEAGYDAALLNERAKVMLAAAGRLFTTFRDDDDAILTLHGRRSSMGIVEAAQTLARDDGERERLGRRADALSRAYGRHCGPQTDTFDRDAPLATEADIRDATDYLSSTLAIMRPGRVRR